MFPKTVFKQIFYISYYIRRPNAWTGNGSENKIPENWNLEGSLFKTAL